MKKLIVVGLFLTAALSASVAAQEEVARVFCDPAEAGAGVDSSGVDRGIGRVDCDDADGRGGGLCLSLADHSRVRHQGLHPD